MCAVVHLAGVVAAWSQTFRITQVDISTQGRFETTFDAVASAYYVLYRGRSVERIDQAVDMGLGIEPSGRLADPVPVFGEFAAFYRVFQIAVDQPLDTDGDGLDDVYELRRPQVLNPLNVADAAQDPDGDGRTHLQEYPTERLPLTTVLRSSPAHGESAVAVTRETIFYFTLPLSSGVTIGPDRLFAEFGGRKLLSRVELSSDRRKVTLFYLENLPGSARVRVTLNGDGLNDSFNRPVDFDGDGRPGGAAVLRFDTLSLTAIPGTAVIGHVFASELQPGPDTGIGAVNKPLAGVTITVDGMEQTMRAVTDTNGFFRLSPVPAGRFFVHIDGRTVVNAAAGIRYPDMAYYPFVGKAWDAVPGREDNLAGGREDTPTGATGKIYLPLIRTGTLQRVSLTEDTTITFPPEVIAGNPALAGVSITVPANALFSDDGTRGGKVGIAPVPPDRLPGPLPPGMVAPLVSTVQSDGPLNFDRPVPICFPNLPDPQTGRVSAPGEKRTLFSFDHDKGIREPVGSMTVTADSRLICTDPGVGILQPGWHVPGPGGWIVKPCDSEDYVYMFFPGIGYVRVDLRKPKPFFDPFGGRTNAPPFFPQNLRGLRPLAASPRPKVRVFEQGGTIFGSEPRHHFVASAALSGLFDGEDAWTLVFANETPPAGSPDPTQCPDPTSDPNSVRVQMSFEGPAFRFLEVESAGQRQVSILREDFILSPRESREFTIRQKNLDKFLFAPYRWNPVRDLEGKDVWLLSTTADFSQPEGARQIKIPPEAKSVIFIARDLANRLHIRILDSNGTRIADVTEPHPSKAAEVAALKQKLAPLWDRRRGRGLRGDPRDHGNGFRRRARRGGNAPLSDAPRQRRCAPPHRERLPPRPAARARRRRRWPAQRDGDRR